MADDSMSEDQWLYGDSNNEGDRLPEAPAPEPEPEVPEEPEKKDEELEPVTDKSEQPSEEQSEADKADDTVESGEITKDLEESQTSIQGGEGEGDGEENDGEGEEEDEEEEEDDDSDDNVHVTIGDIKGAPQYPVIKRDGPSKHIKQPSGKFSIEEFESIGTINGVPAHEFSIDALEEKPWRKPGADITDYFNYGFNEDTWRAYCERQKQMRMHESGVGLSGGLNSAVIIGPGTRKAGPPPGARRPGVIDVIGGSGVASRRTADSPPKENVIQVMTADKRDYGRKSFDMSVPPPGFEAGAPLPPPVVPNYPPAPYPPDFYNPEVDPYYQSYEPAQDLQWGGQNAPMSSKDPMGDPMKSDMGEKMSRERDRDRDRHKERSRHHSRSRSGDRSERKRKHKSRSRSPSHRGHKKKKSKKSDRKSPSD